MSQPKKKELIRSIIDRIIVDYDNNQKTHGLEVNFRIPMGVIKEESKLELPLLPNHHSTVTDFAKFLGWSTLQPLNTAMW